MTEHTEEGWGWPGYLPKPHYFRGGVSLCGSWRYLGTLEAGQAADNDCKACARALKRNPGPSLTQIYATSNAVTCSVRSETRQ